MGKKRSENSISNKENNLSVSDENNSVKKRKATVLDSTDDTDIIESSIVEYENKFNYLKNSQSNSKKAKIFGVSNELLSQGEPKKLKDHKAKELKNLNNSLRNSIRHSFGLKDDIEIPGNIKTDSPLRTPCSMKNDLQSQIIINKIISTLKKSPEVPFLSKSKLRNIEQWLHDNDVETVRTPPFANLSVTPKNSTVKKKCLSKKKIEIENNNANSSIDSEVEEVLKAVYGDDWKQKNVNKHCKTEPKRKTEKSFSPLTEIKKKKSDSFQPVRRNILSSKKLHFADENDEENNDLDNSNVSGVKLINLDDSKCSEEFIINKKLNSVKKRKIDFETSSVESLNLGSVKKAKVKEAVFSNNLENEKQIAKNSTAKNQPKSGVPVKTPKKTFLASLSVSTPNSRCHPDAQYYKINFKSKKDELIKKLYKLYNGEIFGGKLSEDMNFSWNIKLRGTAGYCYNKRITKSTGEVLRVSRIEFSTKIVDRADRLRDTMVHELCHAASWVIDGVLDGHGAVWNGWASKAMKRFPELPLIKRCHNYEIVSKYVYRCTGCGYSIKRHSKSINTERKRCGHCYGVLELLLNKKKKGKGEVPEFDTTRTLRTPNKFALFVKENYHSVKSVKSNAKHAEIMKTLSQQYALVKNGTKSGKKLTED